MQVYPAHSHLIPTPRFLPGRYLSALRADIEIPIDIPVPNSTTSNVDSLYLVGPTDNLRGTFDASLDVMESKCLKDTVQLYEEVGKLDQLGEDQCPERLRVWLKKTRTNAIAYEKEARKVYRAQINAFAHVMATTPVHNSFVS